MNEATLALDAIKQAGHGGHFFGTTHTLANYKTAFYEPIVSDWSNFESWEEKVEKGTAANILHTDRCGLRPPTRQAPFHHDLPSITEEEEGKG